MVGQLISFTEDASATETEIKESNIFVDNGYFCPSGMMENIAQTCAARVGFYNKYVLHKDVQVGFIGAVRNYVINELPPAGSVIHTKVDILQDIFNFHLYLSSVRVFVSIIYIEIFLLSRDISLFFVFLYFSLLRHLARPGPGSRCPPGGPFDKREKKSSQTDHQAAAPGDRPQNKPAAGLL